MKKRILSFFVVLLTFFAFCFMSCEQEIVPENFDDDCLHIVNSTSLKVFRDMVNSGTTFEGKVVVLDRDIDLSKDTEPWKPIGETLRANNDKTDDGITTFLNEKHVFKGNFDGKGHTIRVYVDVNPDKESFVGGVFGIVAGSGSIRNLIVDGLVKNEAAKDSSAAGIVGGIYTKTGETYSIKNCVNKATVEANTDSLNCEKDADNGSGAAGIVARAYGCGTINIEGCTNYGEIKCSGKAGGVVSANANTLTKYSVQKCTNYGKVSGRLVAGGVVGYANDKYENGNAKLGKANAIIRDNTNTGIVCRYRTQDNGYNANIDEKNPSWEWGYNTQVIGGFYNGEPTTKKYYWGFGEDWQGFVDYLATQGNKDNGIVKFYNKDGSPTTSQPAK